MAEVAYRFLDNLYKTSSPLLVLAMTSPKNTITKFIELSVSRWVTDGYSYDWSGRGQHYGFFACVDANRRNKYFRRKQNLIADGFVPTILS
jgi:hypothetical protein